MVAPISEIVDTPIDSAQFIISNGRQDFRACLGPLQLIAGGTVRIGIQSAMALRLRVGDSVRFVTPRPIQVKEAATDGSGYRAPVQMFFLPLPKCRDFRLFSPPE